MYQKILVPLDGSQLAECVLPHVETVVKGCHIPDVIFFRVVEPGIMPIGTLSDAATSYTEEEAGLDRARRDSDAKTRAEGYLNKLISGLRVEANMKAETAIGKPAETIAEYIKKNNIDLVIIATHGRSGISRWVMGSTADKVIRSCCVPVFMVRAPGCIPGF